MKRRGIIYIIVNKINGMIYIGSTKYTIKKRWYQHCYAAKTNIHSYLYNAIRKYGKNNFKVKEICTILDESILNEIEEYFINKFDSYSPKGYNMVDPVKQEFLADLLSAKMIKDWADPEIRKHRKELLHKAGEHQAIPIVAVSIYDGSVVFYDRVHDARRAGFSVSSIYSALNKQVKTGQKQCWFYKTVDDPNFYKKQALELIRAFKDDFLKPIEGINIQTGEIISFNNCEDLANKGFKPKQVRRVIRGERKQAVGYYWRFKK